jgi:hypothetical protein
MFKRFFAITRKIPIAEVHDILAGVIKSARRTPYVQFCPEYYSGEFVDALNQIVNTGLLSPATMKSMILTVDAALSSSMTSTIEPS